MANGSTSQVTPAKPAASKKPYTILTGFIFKQGVYTVNGEGSFTDAEAAILLKRGVVEPAKKKS